MSARVNLLPEETRRKGRASRSQGLLVFLGFVLIGVLVTASVLQRGTLAEAEAELAEAEAEQSEVRADVAALEQFADLTDRLSDTRTVVSELLGPQVTIAGVLQDLAMVIPADADVAGLDVNLAEPSTEDDSGQVVGTMRLSGESVGRIAPGIERLLLALDKVAGFRNIHVSNAAVDDDEVTSFDLDLELGPENRTGRYDDGVPGAVR